MSFKAASAGFSFTGHPESIQLASPLALTQLAQNRSRFSIPQNSVRVRSKAYAT